MAAARGHRPGDGRAGGVRHRRSAVCRGLLRTSCTTPRKPAASISGGWTGSRASRPTRRGWTRCGGSITCISTTWAAMACSGPSSSRAGAGWATTATPSASPATRSSPGIRWPSSPISPPPRPTSAMAGGATTSAGTWGGSRRPSSTCAGCSTASSARSCACTAPTTPSRSAARGAGDRRWKGRRGRPCSCATR